MLRSGKLSSKTLNLLNILESKLTDFYLAGGTALAMYYEHRVSFDLDFFTAQPYWPEVLLEYLKQFGVLVEKVRVQTGTLEAEIDGVRTSFFEYHYALIEPFNKYGSLDVASVIDIAAMKLSAIAKSREKGLLRSRRNPEERVFGKSSSSFCQKYGREVDLYHIVRAVAFFDDVEDSPDPSGAVLTWKEVKQSLKVKSKELFDVAKSLVRLDRD
jgi:hypothetical protein